MIYCLMTSDKSIRIEVKCELKKRPKNIEALIRGIKNKSIVLMATEGIDSEHGLADFIFAPNQTLETDWERTGVQARRINWPRTEDTK